VRSAGLAFGVALREDDAMSAADRTSALVNGLRARRILVSASGIAQDVLKIRPPLCFSREDADALLEATAAVLAELADRPAGGA
jgi:4-aminobutyrate aminotransferase-like enzyme